MAVLTVVGMLATSTVAASAQNEDGLTYAFEVTAGSANSLGVVTATVNGDSIEIVVAAEGLGVEEVVMHFHEGTSCDANGGVVVSVPAGPVPAAGGSLRLETTEPLGAADMENVYFNIHEAANLGNVVACATLANAYENNYFSQPDDSASLVVNNLVAGDTVLTSVDASGLSAESVVMHFHAGSTCDANGDIVLGVDGTVIPVTGGVLLGSSLAPFPASGFDDPADLYFNVHDGANLANILACGTLNGAPGRVTDATSIDEIINASDYDVNTDPEILRLYQAFFNREPDVGGAIYWIGIRKEFGALEIAQSFPSASAEFQNVYQDAPSDEEFLTRVYSNMLDRVPDQDGFDYWLDILGGTNESGQNPTLAQGDRGAVVFYVAINEEFINQFPYLP